MNKKTMKQAWWDDIISVTEAAALKGLNESSIRKAIRTKRLALHKKIGSAHLVSREEVLALPVVGHRPKKDRDISCQKDPT